MKKLTALLLSSLLSLGILGCASSNAAGENQNADAPVKTTATAQHKIKITVNGQTLTATLENNAATQALLAKMPMTLAMQDLYGREMCYRYGQGTLPTSALRSDGYQVGDIAYWPPRGSLVILYEQNGEHFTRQHLGRVDNGVEIFKSTGNANVTFEILE